VQTTVGFGNQLPTQSFSSRIVVTQAVLGQVFLVTLVARLVSLYGDTRRTAHHAGWVMIVVTTNPEE
jgi:hypothetical protein